MFQKKVPQTFSETTQNECEVSGKFSLGNEIRPTFLLINIF